MPTLAAAVNATETLFSMDEALPAGTKFLRVDDELVRVQSIAYRAYQRVEPDPSLCTVVRGVEGTAAVSHDVGAELEPHVDAYTTPTPFSVGGEQRIRQYEKLLDVTDEAAWQSDGFIVAELESGQTVLNIWVVVVVSVELPNEAIESGAIWFQIDPPGGVAVQIHETSISLVASGAVSAGARASRFNAMLQRFADEQTGMFPYRIQEATSIVFYGDSGVVPASGEAYIYTLIAEPAA